MKLFHISDLHIGKQLYLYSLKEIQEEILDQIVAACRAERPDALLIAGDIFDKAVPSGEAYEVFDRFLSGLAGISPSVPVLIIAGNHDSAARLKYGSAFFKKNHIHISVMPPATEEEHLEKITLTDAYGPVHFYLLPFTKPGYVRKLFGEERITDHNAAVKALIEREDICFAERNVLVAHQFFVSGETSPEPCDSELTYLSAGGLDYVDTACVEGFDYVALGHIHGPQKIGAEHIRYSGSPYKYSVSEERHVKGIQVVELGPKGTPNGYSRIPLVGRRDVRSIRGSLREVIERASEGNREDYVSITLTDEELYRPKDQLEEYYTHILEVRADNKRTRSRLQQEAYEGAVLSPADAFAEFYAQMNGQPLSPEEEKEFCSILSELDGEEPLESPAQEKETGGE